MRNVSLSFPMFGFVVGTRAALGAGIGLLVAAKMSEQRRRALGWTLVSIGVATTVPAALAVFGRRKASVTLHPSARPADDTSLRM